MDPNYAYWDPNLIVLSWCHIIISSYSQTSVPYHSLIIPYHHIVPSQCCRIIHHTAKNCKSVLAEKSTKKRKSPFLPLRQESYRVEIGFIGGSFSRRTCQERSKKRCSSKTAISWFDAENFWQKICWKFFWGVEKWNIGDRLKRVFPKFEAERSRPRGVNGCSKFCKNSIICMCSASKNETSGIIWNAFSQNFRPNRAILGR